MLRTPWKNSPYWKVTAVTLYALLMHDLLAIAKFLVYVYVCMHVSNKFVTVQVRELATETPPDVDEEPEQSFDDEVEVIKMTRDPLLAVRRSTSLQRSSLVDEQSVQDHPDDSDGACVVGNYVATPGESSGKNDKQPGYVSLYDERLIEDNMHCYIQ